MQKSLFDLNTSSFLYTSGYTCKDTFKLATRDINILNSDNTLSVAFYSHDNIGKIYNEIVSFIKNGSNNKIDVGCVNINDIRKEMRNIYYRHAVVGIDMNTQLKNLNDRTVCKMLSIIIPNIRHQYHYYKTISNPIVPIDNPVNLNAAGEKINTLYMP